MRVENSAAWTKPTPNGSARRARRGREGVEEDSGHRLVEQLLSVSRLVHAKYALTRKALISLGIGTALCLLGIVVDALIG